jgi:hypothetical protein
MMNDQIESKAKGGRNGGSETSVLVVAGGQTASRREAQRTAEMTLGAPEPSFPSLFPEPLGSQEEAPDTFSCPGDEALHHGYELCYELFSTVLGFRQQPKY